MGIDALDSMMKEVEEKVASRLSTKAEEEMRNAVTQALENKVLDPLRILEER